MFAAVRRLAAASTTVALLALAGCGDGDEVKRDNAYVDRVNAAQRDFERTVDRLTGQITEKSSPRQDAATLRGYDGAVGRVVTRLRAIEPPAAARSLHARLVGAISTYGREVRAAARSLSSSDPDKLIVGQQRLLTATSTVQERINATIASINTALKA